MVLRYELKWQAGFWRNRKTVWVETITGLDTNKKEIPLFPDKGLLVGVSLLESRGLTEKFGPGFIQ